MTKSPARPRKAKPTTEAKKSRAPVTATKTPKTPVKRAIQPAAKPAKPRKTAAVAEQKPQPAAEEFPIVGIGASAGGLEALEQFLAHAPPASGMAYIVIQHLDPNRKGMMPELLQRTTRMKVAQAADNMLVERDHVYVIPPNMDMSLLQGVLHLFEFHEPRAQRLPIDFFFRSLAVDRRHFAIGVVLSGMGSDGTLGLRAIKENAGLALAQDPASARFDAMPRSAIEAGLADIVAPAEDLPSRIITYFHHAPLAVRPDAELESVDAHGSLDKILVVLRMHTGHDFTLYKKSTLYRRIERRMGIHQIDRIPTYVRFLRENPAEQDLLFKELLIGVTGFFRDPEAWEVLKTLVLPELFAAVPSGRMLRAWVAGCSTGEEAYSLAILFREALEELRPQGRFTLQIYATDLDRAAIEKARLGHYPSNIAADVSPERINRYFTSDESGYRVAKEIREMVIFAPQNLIMDPPFTKLDILSCRNLLIYLGPELQKKLIPLFQYSLNPGGILFLGSAETIGSFTDLFAPVDAKARLYRRSEVSLRMGEVEFPTKLFAAAEGGMPDGARPPPVVNLQAVAEKLLLRSYSPPAVLVNPKGDIVYINGRTGKYLEPASGRANWNILAMARGDLRHELAAAMQRVQQERGPVTVRGIRLDGNGHPLYLDLVLEALEEPVALSGMIIVVFHEQPPPELPKQKRGGPHASASAQRVAELETEAQHLREQLQITREEMQSSQEELKSSNEELQSTNEELQSTNEELTTSREEMQSLNEELQTVNAELQNKVEELSRASDDLKNLLNSTDIAIIFLDNELRVRSFTDSAVRLIKLIPSDVGRPMSDIVSELEYPQMQADAKAVLRSLVYVEKEVPTREGRVYMVRIIPYRTTTNVIDGVVFTFVDITRAKKMEVDLHDALAKNLPKS